MRKASWHGKFKRSKKEVRTCDGMTFDSLSEMNRYRQLRLMQKAKVISRLRCQVPYDLIMKDGTAIKTRTGRISVYTADFVYIEDGKEIIEEHKGFLDRASAFRIAVFEAIYGVTVLITRMR